jgi:hypothetical protein
MALMAAAILLGLLALHVELNLGGFGRVLARLRSPSAVRGDLAVGFLPVT